MGKKWKAYARRNGRPLSVDLWSATFLTQRLTTTDFLHAGRLRYWFDHTVLETNWFKVRFAEARASLGERYTPETNVDLPIRRALLAFGRDPVMQDEIEALLADSTKSAIGRSALWLGGLMGIRRPLSGSWRTPPTGLWHALQRFRQSLIPICLWTIGERKLNRR
jgi:hypothetical protein